MSAKITLFAHGTTPNPCKVAVLLEELGVEYDVVQKVRSGPVVDTNTICVVEIDDLRLDLGNGRCPEWNEKA